MIKYVEICQRTKQYRIPLGPDLFFSSYEGLTLQQLKEKIMSEHNEKFKENPNRNPNCKCVDVIFEEIESTWCGMII